MRDMNPPKILVGIETACCEAALQYAVAEALRRQCGVHLLHVAWPALRAACSVDDVAMVEGELRRVGGAVLADAASRTEHLLIEMAGRDEPLPVSTELTHGSVVASLDSLSAHACLVVLQHEGMGATGETDALSVTCSVATRAHCPVVAVPAGWRPSPEPRGIVAVGVDLLAPSAPVVEAAFREAARRGSRLRAVHAFQPAGNAFETHEDQLLRLRSWLADIVAEARPAAPDVVIELAVEPGSPGQVLRELSRHSDVVLVGHRRKHVVGASVGQPVRELLRWSDIPVVVVDPARGDVLAFVPETYEANSASAPKKRGSL